MYRDDICAVCGESLPPDHLYCREHAAVVDDLLHDIGRLLPAVTANLQRLAEMIAQIHPDTWDYLAEERDDDPLWPPRPDLVMTTDGEDVDVDVDRDPGKVTVSIRTDLSALLADVAAALSKPGLEELSQSAAKAEGAGATH